MIGLPSPYTCLCYVQSAGVPRELERAAAALVHLEFEDTSDDHGFRRRFGPRLKLAHVARTLVAADVASKLRAFTFTVHQRPPGEAASDVVVALNTVGGLARPSEEDLVARLDSLAATLCRQADDDDPELAQICSEAAGAVPAVEPTSSEDEMAVCPLSDTKLGDQPCQASTTDLRGDVAEEVAHQCCVGTDTGVRCESSRADRRGSDDQRGDEPGQPVPNGTT
ncbi:hypothetical protein [Amycolatopsis panacis]|uniref:hypothetical protein n=1 Tax=Amycolatopsis panacis TaxID=2340917 RepID=UPI0011C3CF99|nr:hypothetical protein [Amycolatopsis panacis]